MGLCELCGQDFPRCTTSKCRKCIKLEGAATEIDRVQIQQTPQCRSCSIVYPFLQTPECGACLKQKDDAASLAQSITEDARAYQETASTFRLNQESSRKQNSALQAATAVKAKLSTLQKQNKAEMFAIDMELWYYPIGKGNMKKAQIMTAHTVWNGSTMIADALDATSKQVAAAYMAVPSKLDLNFEGSVGYGVQSTKAVCQLEMPKPVGSTIADVFEMLKGKGSLSDADIRRKLLALRMVVYQLAPTAGSDGDEPSTPPTKKVNGSAKRKLSQAAPQYKSAYQPRKLSALPSAIMRTANLAYDKYIFTRIQFEVNKSGDVTEYNDWTVDATIEVARDWQKYRLGGEPRGGYISKGLTKYAFEGRLDGVKYAIFQNQPTSANSSENQINVIAELRLIVQADYFLNSFNERAKTFRFVLPAQLRWNSEGAFVGQVRTPILKAPPGSTPDHRSLLFDHFLAAPYIETLAFDQETKFSGNEEAGNNTDEVGKVVDAYAHHVFVDSHGTLVLTDLQGIIRRDKSVILFDPQAHSWDKSTGFWDKGADGMRDWRAQHKCNSVCKKLGLNKEKVEVAQVAEEDEKPVVSPLSSPTSSDTTIHPDFLTKTAIFRGLHVESTTTHPSATQENQVWRELAQSEGSVRSQKWHGIEDRR